MPQEQKSERFYYHAAGYTNEQLSSEVFQNLDSSIKHAQFNLSTYRILVPESNVWAVVVIGEKPDAEFDAIIFEYLANTGEIVDLPDDVLRNLLARRPDMN
jgi:predicted membrane-bound spermidine synthase